MASHTHDGIDWTVRLAAMRRADDTKAEVGAWVAQRLVDPLPDGATVVDVGAGAGGMAAAFAAALAARRGGRIVLVDAVPQLQAAAVERVRAVAGDRVEVVPVLADAADPGLVDVVPAADLVWASGIVHHLPNQIVGLTGLAALLRPGGWLALGEGGLNTRCLPWDLGIGEPGLQDRLVAARDAWFADMRAGIGGVVRLPVGWNRALGDIGLHLAGTFSYLVDLPAPAAEPVRRSVADWLHGLATIAGDRLSQADRDTVTRLLDEDGPDWIVHRDDTFILSAATVHLATKPDA
ncbi:class I SAM-dependent methyltransferase [Actinokineospora auranticolor]|uniref:Methyltransferase family protein n=1 Tax=Actinokineospora auranticolor TaxID=155976 RepID=A0A2S6GB58_9PSEU|nr:class I SAM-dependent methyltransferase [Actinokineospora auranticolor]PPK60830.1 methyltransferase family protein [Actinokineospora auranticolor]